MYFLSWQTVTKILCAFFKRTFPLNVPNTGLEKGFQKCKRLEQVLHPKAVKSGIKISSYSLLRCFPLLNLASIKSVILSSAGEWGGGGTEKYGFKNSSEDNIPCQLVREYK
jgi:hypothetical protein